MKKLILLSGVMVFTLLLGVAAFAAGEPGIDNGITVFSTAPVTMDDGSVPILAGSGELWRDPDAWAANKLESSGSAAGGMREGSKPFNGITYFDPGPATKDLSVPDKGSGANDRPSYNGITAF